MTDPAILNALGRVALVHEAHLGALVADYMRAATPRADTTMRGERDPDQWRGYRVDNGAAIIPLRGSLITDGPFIGSIWGITSYEGFRAEMRRAAADPKVSRIVLAVNSPGGMVAGIDNAAAAIADAKAAKPVVAMVEGMAASAAYWLASQADEIVLSPLSEVGSIGVVAMHVDMSGYLEKAGVSVSLIHAGRHKVDGNPYEPLSEATRADIQADIDRLRLEFANAVGAGRGARFDAAKAMSTEARMFDAQTAVKEGLADRIGSLDSILSLSGVPRGRVLARKGVPMSDNQGATGADTPVFTQAQHEAALASARRDASINATAAERERVSAILDSDEARTRGSLARHFAFKTGMSAEDARAALAASAEEGNAAPASPLAAAMAAHKPASLGPGGERNAAAQPAKVIDAADIYARRAAAVGRR
ncbi:signal peptide peptidase SppA [Rhodoblastus acidophilus]|uniref:S49 family peptidase n=1 Tax=Rhodoblastus acidophilus TaxID=1074 RepID=UPI0022259649|nr:S49 family peptidase [Rhodoblastus acidophilus]MCW2319192.1 signal peptide peptidase SppA [Rhodoblastus acidophilus]